MDDITDFENERNVKFETEQFPNRWEERKKDRIVPFSYEPQVLTDLIANGYRPRYPAESFPIMNRPTPSPPAHGM